MPAITMHPNWSHQLLFAFRTTGDSVDGVLPFGWPIAAVQKWTLIYLGISSLAFVVVWVVGFLRR